MFEYLPDGSTEVIADEINTADELSEADPDKADEAEVFDEPKVIHKPPERKSSSLAAVMLFQLKLAAVLAVLWAVVYFSFPEKAGELSAGFADALCGSEADKAIGEFAEAFSEFLRQIPSQERG